jgi:uncharacterized 2Fe-2S/4Fe-4S cluster protein (DUF4445 family)
LFSEDKIIAASAAAGTAFEGGNVRGSESVRLCAELIRGGLLDESGLLLDETNSSLTQADIREFQLAKSAVRAGIEILLEESGVLYENVQEVFIAGAFGYRIDIESACDVGLVPAQFKDRIKAVGNAALNGCVKYLLKPSDEIVRLAKKTQEINLSLHPKFNEFFIKHMNFIR